jgi:hypothetical protein
LASQRWVHRNFQHWFGRWRWEQATGAARDELHRRLRSASSGSEMAEALSWYQSLGLGIVTAEAEAKAQLMVDGRLMLESDATAMLRAQLGEAANSGVMRQLLGRARSAQPVLVGAEVLEWAEGLIQSTAKQEARLMREEQKRRVALAVRGAFSQRSSRSKRRWAGGGGGRQT